MPKSAYVLAPVPEIRQELCDALDEEGLEVVGLGKDALFYGRLASAGYPDLVVISVQSQDPLAVLMGMQSSDTCPPVVVVSSMGTRDRAAHLVRMGAQANIVMPLDEAEFRTVCRRALRHSDTEIEVRRLRVDLEDFRNMLSSALTHLHEGAMVIDPGSRVLFINKEGARLMLKEREELVGEPLDPIFGEGFFKALTGAKQSKEGWIDTKVVISSGEILKYLVTRAVLLRDLAGDACGGLLLFKEEDS